MVLIGGVRSFQVMNNLEMHDHYARMGGALLDFGYLGFNFIFERGPAYFRFFPGEITKLYVLNDACVHKVFNSRV